MTKIRQKRFSNGKTQQRPALTLKAFHEDVKRVQNINLSLQEAYEIAGGYRQIDAKSPKARIILYKRALEMVQQDDPKFAKLLIEDKAKVNSKVQQALDLTEAYNIVGGYSSVDKAKFAQAVEYLKSCVADPEFKDAEFVSLLIKFAESHSSFREADSATLTAINEKGLAFFEKQDVQKVVEDVVKDEKIQQAFEATPIDFTNVSPEAQNAASEVAQEGIVYTAATDVAMDMAANGHDDASFEDEVKKQTEARIVTLRLEEINDENSEKAVIEAIKTGSDKPLTKFQQKMKNAWNFTKKISISSEKVATVCDKAKAKWNKFTKKVSVSAKTALVNAEFTAHQFKPRGKAACLAGLMMVSTFLTSCNNKSSSSNDGTYTQAQVDSIKQAAANEAVANFMAEQQRQQAEAAAKAQAEAQAQAAQAHRDSIMNMDVPHEWNDNMRIKKGDLSNVQYFFNQADSGRYDRLYRNLELAKDSLPEIVQTGDSVASKVTNEQMLKRIYQQLQFRYGVQVDEQGNPVIDNKGNPVYEERQAYIAAQSAVQALDRPCDGQEFNIADLSKANLQLLFDTPIPVGSDEYNISGRPYFTRPDCGEDGQIRGTRRVIKQTEVVDSVITTVRDSIAIDSLSSDIALGVQSQFTAEADTNIVVKAVDVNLTKHKQSTASDGSVAADTNLGRADVASALTAGENAANNEKTVFVADATTQFKTDSTAVPSFTLGVQSNVRNDSIATDSMTTDSLKNITLGVQSNVHNDSIAADSVVTTLGDSTNLVNNASPALSIQRVLNPENDSIPMGASAAWGEMSGRSGWNYTSVTEKQIKDDKRYFGAETYANSISVLESRPELFKFGQVFEGLTPHEVMRSTRALMKWSVKRNGDFAKFRVQALALTEFIKGKCKDSFTAEETMAIRDAFAAVHTNMSIDNVIGRGGSNNVTYTLDENCDNLGKPTFVNGSSSNVTRPSGPYFERRYFASMPSIQLGVQSSFTFTQETEEIAQQVSVNVRKVKTSTDSSGRTVAPTDKGNATVTDATRAGNKAAQNTSHVFVEKKLR